jgi:hypothetical protein
MIAASLIGETTVGETVSGATPTGATTTGEMIVRRRGGIIAIDTLTAASSVAFRGGETETLTDTAFLETGDIALPEIGGVGIRGLARSTLPAIGSKERRS